MRVLLKSVTATAVLAGLGAALSLSPAVAADTIKIGVITDQTGRAKFYAEPVLQGILFLVIGFLFLGRVSPRTRLARRRLRRRYPKWAAKYDAIEGKARAWINRRFRRGKNRGTSAAAEKPLQ